MSGNDRRPIGTNLDGDPMETPRKKSIGFEVELTDVKLDNDGDYGGAVDDEVDDDYDEDEDEDEGEDSQIIPGKSRKGQFAKRKISKFLKKKKKAFMPAVKKALHTNYVQFILGIVLLLSLFLPDSWTIINPANNMDIFLNVILIICIAIFTIEIIVMSLVHSDYINSVFFWLDIVGTISIVIDLTWFTSDVLSSGGVDPRTLRAARIAKIGAKAARLTRVTKFIKYFHISKKKESDEQGHAAEHISAQISSILSQRVAALIMTLVILSSFSSLNIEDFSASGFILSFDQVASIDGFTSTQWFDAMENFHDFYREQIEKKELTLDAPVWLQLRGISSSNCPTSQSDNGIEIEWIDQTNDDFNGYCRFDFEFDKKQAFNNIIRYQNKRFATSIGHPRYNEHKSCSSHVPEFAYVCNKLSHVDVLFNHTAVSIEDAWRSITMICVIVFLLLSFTATFNYAVQDLVVKPISRIISHITSTLEVVVVNSVTEMGMDDEGDENGPGLSETDILEKMVNKLASIVQTSLGEKKRVMFSHHGMDTDTKAWLTADYDISGSQTQNDGKDEFIRRKIEMRDGSVSRMTANLPVHVDDLNSFDFDILSIEKDELLPCILYMFERHGLLREFKVDHKTFDIFIHSLENGYRHEPQYHNWYHGVDVMHTVYRMFDSTNAGEYMSKLEFYASFVAALAHDLGHLGVNNTFLVKSKHPLALLHNDVSPLENMHASKLYDILRDPTCNIMLNLDDIQWQTARKLILTCILNTDMAFHFDNLKKLEMFEEVNGVFILEFLEQREFRNIPIPPCLQDHGNRLLLQECFLHAADLGNPVKPFHIYQKWVSKITEEFFTQGKQEKELGLPMSPMCDREVTNIPNMQLGFMDFIVAPFYLALFKIFPSGLFPLAENIQSNYIRYAQLRIQEFPNEKENISEKIKSFKGKFQENGLDISGELDGIGGRVLRARNSIHHIIKKKNQKGPGSPLSKDVSSSSQSSSSSSSKLSSKPITNIGSPI